MALAIVGLTVFLILPPVALPLIGGDPTWPTGCAYNLVYLGAGVGSHLAGWRLSPDMLRERAGELRAADVPAWDQGLVDLGVLVGPLAAVIVAGLNHRFGWLPAVPGEIQLVALVLFAAGSVIGVGAMLVTPFTASFLRIRKERGHRVLSSGAYAFLRRPAHASGVVAPAAAPVLWDALWAWIPAGLIAATLVLRAAKADRVLQAQLPGHREYASRVRSRLVPGGWWDQGE